MRKSQLILNKQKQKALNDFKPTVVVNYEPNERPDNIKSDSFDDMLNLGVSKGELRTMEFMADGAPDSEGSSHSGDDSESIATDSQESEASTVKKTSSTSSEYDIIEKEEDEIFKPLADDNGVYDEIIKNLKDFSDNGHKAKNWVFTIWRKWNKTISKEVKKDGKIIKPKITQPMEFNDKDWAKLIDDLLKLADGFAHFIIFGDELGNNKTSEKDAQHLQGFIQLPNPMRMSQLKKMFPEHTYFGKMYSTVAFNMAYCKKQNGSRQRPYYEAGKVPTTEGHRSDRDIIVKAIEEGKTARDIATEYPKEFITFGKTIERLEQLREKPANRFGNEIIYITGWPGSGKTRFVSERYECEHIYFKDDSNWWDNYDKNKKCVLIDDIDFKKWDFKTLLRLLDIYQYQGQTKGSYVQMKAEKIYITHAEPLIHAKKALGLDDFNFWQLQRRIKFIVCLQKMKIYRWDDDAKEHIEANIEIKDFDICGKLNNALNLESYKAAYIPFVLEQNEKCKKSKFKFLDN